MDTIISRVPRTDVIDEKKAQEEEDDVSAKIKDILMRCDLNGDGLISYEG